MYFCFMDTAKTKWVKATSLKTALRYSRNQEDLVFKSACGTARPLYLHPIKNGRVDKEQLLRWGKL